jgi:hypothetical protein
MVVITRLGRGRRVVLPEDEAVKHGMEYGDQVVLEVIGVVGKDVTITTATSVTSFQSSAASSGAPITAFGTIGTVT